MTEDIENKYTHSKIYTIRSPQTDKYYIGSTCNPLYKRLYNHKAKYKLYNAGKCNNITSFQIVKFNDCYIELLENCNFETKEQLLKREGELIREHYLKCINRCIAGRTINEYKIENREQILKYKNIKHICNICNGKFTNSNLGQHKQTSKHLNEIKPKIKINFDSFNKLVEFDLIAKNPRTYNNLEIIY